MLVKLVLVALLLGLAALNKLRLTPALRAGHPRARSRLLWSIRIEAVVVLAVLVTTSTLTTVASPSGHERAAEVEAETEAVPAPPGLGTLAHTRDILRSRRHARKWRNRQTRWF